MRTAIIIDPGMGNIPGHWSNYNKLLSDQLSSKHYRPIIFSNKKIEEKIAADLRLVKCFDNDPYVPWVVFGDLRQTFDNICKYGKLYSKNILRGREKIETGEGGLLICPTITPPILYGILNYIRSQKLWSTKCKIIFQFSDGLCLENFNQHENIFGIGYQYVLEEFAPLLTNNNSIKYFASTPEFAYVLNLMLNVSVIGLPMIQGDNQLGQHETHVKTTYFRGGKNLTIGLYGHSSKSKGSDFIYKLLLEKLRDNRSLTLNLHYNPNSATELDDEVRLLEHLPNVRMIRGFVDKNKLLNFMEKSDIILLPYEPSNYLFMMSAIFIEALILRKVTIVPKNTVMWKIVNKFSCGSGFSDLKYKSVSEALELALNNYNELSINTEIAAKYVEFDRADRYLERELGQ